VGADVVIFSSAVPHDNPELVAARAAGLPVVKRAAILGEMMANRVGIAVAGTHGKTTTSALISFLLSRTGLDPTFIVGGVLQNTDTNAHHGEGPHFVVEADEYDYTFLGLCPKLAVVTVIEMDHPDCFADIEEVADAFEGFLRLLPEGATAVGCADEARVGQLLQKVQNDREIEVITYGLQRHGVWQAQQVRRNAWGGSDFEIVHEGQPLGTGRLRLPGLHNVSNALAALVVTHRLGLEMGLVLEALPHFRGVRRRFEIKGEAGGVVVVDDYAHHPTEIQATLAAARQCYGQRRLWVFFQPHTYSRTKALLNGFAASFKDADHVLVSEIYAARETDTLGICAGDLVRRMEHSDVRLVADLQEASELLQAALQTGDVLLTLGAGDGDWVGEVVLRALAARIPEGEAARGYAVQTGPVGNRVVSDGS
jgi:UDP-N-acetylmuramate--alanine ligase